MLAYRHLWLNFFSAYRTINQPLRNESPISLDPKRKRGPTVHVRYFAVRMASRPHSICFRDELLIPLYPRRLRDRDLVFAGPRTRADENAMRLEILNQIGGDFSRRNCERKAAVIA